MDKMLFTICNNEVLINCLSTITREHEKQLIDVIVSDHKADRTAAQRRLQYMWYTDIAKHQGHTIEYIRDYYMRKFAVNIFYRDDINCSADTLDALKDLKARGMIQHYEALLHGFVKNITTNSFTTSQNREYLDSVFMHASDNGIALRVPDDLKYAYEAR